MSDLILVLDEGTTSTRAMLFTPVGQGCGGIAMGLAMRGGPAEVERARM